MYKYIYVCCIYEYLYMYIYIYDICICLSELLHTHTLKKVYFKRIFSYLQVPFYIYSHMQNISIVAVILSMCCSVLQCVIVCCGILQSVAVHIDCLNRVVNMIQCIVVCRGVLRYVAVCCSVLWCVAMCCDVLQCVAVCCSVLQCSHMNIISVNFWPLMHTCPIQTCLQVLWNMWATMCGFVNREKSGFQKA